MKKEKRNVKKLNIKIKIIIGIIILGLISDLALNINGTKTLFYFSRRGRYSNYTSIFAAISLSIFLTTTYYLVVRYDRLTHEEKLRYFATSLATFSLFAYFVFNIITYL